jgi:biopolymer transport protein ExbB/TolQ
MTVEGMTIEGIVVLVVLMLLSTAAVFAMAAQIHQWTKQYGWRSHFREAFDEWSSSCDWQGYDEIPATMYEDLVARLETAK